MNSRLTLVANQVSASSKQPKIIDSAIEWMEVHKYFNEEQNAQRIKLRETLEKEVLPKMTECIDKAEFPYFALPLLKQLGLQKNYIGKPYGHGLHVDTFFYTILELSRIDASLNTFFMVQVVLLTNTIDKFGGELLRKKYLPKLADLELLGGWGLTEREYGSDASSLQSYVTKVEGGYILNGNKRWIGNANFDLLVVFARDKESKNVQAFVVETSWKGVKREIIKGKYALRPVQNVQLDFTDVFIPEENKLTGVKSFQDVAEMLAHSRLWVCVSAAGVALGLYDFTIPYITKRKQFGKTLSSYQLVQEKLIRIMAIAQESLLLCKQLVDQYKSGKITIGQIAMTKSYITTQLRESARLARELMGANGILIENHTMKSLLDAEVILTYEGTKDINTLVAGRELTGIAAFKQC